MREYSNLHKVIERVFIRLSALLGAPLFWVPVILTLNGTLAMNILSRNAFDPNMSYSNFVQNELQVIALAVTSVATVALARAASHSGRSIETLHDKIDELHDKHDALHDKL